jgi:phosphoglycerate dehydrogenase-like enzyme
MSDQKKKKGLITARFTREGVDILDPFLEVTRAGYGTSAGILSENEVVSLVSDKEVLVVELEPVTKAVMNAAPKLQMIGSCRGTPSNVEMEEATRRGLPVLFTPGRNAVSVAELTLNLMLTLARNTMPAVDSLRNGVWASGDDSPFIKFRGIELYAKKLGLVGYGAIGKEVAQRAQALGMKVLVYDPFVPEESITAVGGIPVPLEELLKNCDFLSLHAKISDSTKGMIGKAQLALMKKTAYLINTASGLLVDEEALIRVLQNKQIAGAGLDVFATEPLPKNHLFLELDNVIATPHIGGATSDVTVHQSVMMAEDIRACLLGQTPRNIYNPEVLTSK